MRVRARDRLEHRRVADVEVLDAAHTEIVADGLAARADGMEVDPERLLERRRDRPAEAAQRVVPREVADERTPVFERRAIAGAAEQPVLDRVERHATARV